MNAEPPTARFSNGASTAATRSTQTLPAEIMQRLPQHSCVRLLANVAAELVPCISDIADAITLRSIDSSIEKAKEAAWGTFPRTDLREPSDMATRLTGKLELFSRGIFLEDDDRYDPLASLSGDQLKLIRDVADIAARALRAATRDESNANEECHEGLSWAYDVAERRNDDELLDRIQLLVDETLPL